MTGGRFLSRRGLWAPALAVTLALGVGVSAPGAADRRSGPGGHPDGHSYDLRPADAAELARALHLDAPGGARLSGTQARTALATASRVSASRTSGPDFELPFLCGTQWTGSTRSGHSPSYYSVDFNAPSDQGKPVVASAPGTVTLVRSLTYSYGRYVVVDHGDGYTTLYAHLDSLAATVGQRVDQGDLLGYLGTSGNSTGPHLHFEQRRNGGYFPPWFNRTTWRFGDTATSRSCGDRPVAGDWDDDGVDEVGVFRPRAVRTQYLLDHGVGQALRWGYAGDTPLVADYDGDGVDQVGTKRRGNSIWRLRSASGAVATVTGVGGRHDVPLAGDWNGDGRAELGWYRWSNRTFYLRWPDMKVRTVRWGSAGQVPVVGDWNGDGVDEVGSFDPTNGRWALRVTSDGTATTRTVGYGRAGDLPVVVDHNGDDVDELAIWRPRTGNFHLRTVSDGARVTSLVKPYGAARG